MILYNNCYSIVGTQCTRREEIPENYFELDELIIDISSSRMCDEVLSKSTNDDDDELRVMYFLCGKT